MEVYFVDVGQGTCNVILTGGRRAVVVDTGRRYSDLRLLLHSLNIDHLSCLILSHLDVDHVGGAPRLMTEFRGRIDRICYPNDHRMRGTQFWRKLHQELRAGHLRPNQLVHLTFEQNPKQLWRSRSLQAELKLFSPSFGENQVAQAARDANAVSGVLVLKVGKRRVIFAGDSGLDQWEEIHRRCGQVLDCEVLAVPHHAGVTWPSHWDAGQVTAGLTRMYNQWVRPARAVVSVGTSNIDHHPRPEVVAALRSAGATVLCTQVTTQCHPDLEGVRPGVLPLLLTGRSSADRLVTRAGNSRDVACAGTIVLDITPTAANIARFDQHQAGVTALAAQRGGSPLCRT